MQPGDIAAVGDDTIVLRDAQLNIARGINLVTGDGQVVVAAQLAGVRYGDRETVTVDFMLTIGGAEGLGRALLEAGSAARDHEQSGAGR